MALIHKKPKTRGAFNPLLADPTRTTTLRRVFSQALRGRLKILAQRVNQVIINENALGITVNVFCPTGPGGGVDPSCSPIHAKLTAQTLALSGEAKSIIEEYQTSGLYDPLNNFLRTGKLASTGELAGMDSMLFQGGFGSESKAWAKQYIKDLDRVLASTKTSMDLVVYRGIGKGIVKPKIGDILEDKGFTSTSLDYKVAHGFADKDGIVIALKLPRGSKALYADPIVDLGQHEMILARGSKIQVDKLEKIGDRTIVHTSIASTQGTKPDKQIASPSVSVPKASVKKLNKDSEWLSPDTPDRARSVIRSYKKKLESDPKYDTPEKVLKRLAEAYPTYITNTRWSFNTTSEQVKAFSSWFLQQAQELLYQQEENSWWREYVQKAYQQGAGATWAKWRDKTKFLQEAFNNPVQIERVKTLAGRVLTELQNVSQTMATQMSRSLVDGLAQGKSPRDVAKDLTATVSGLGENRASMIAQTETIRAHAEGQLDSLENLGMDQVGIQVEWSTSHLGKTKVTGSKKKGTLRGGNPSPCNLCKPMKGAVFTIQES